MTHQLGLWIGFSKVSGIGPARFKNLIEYYGNVETAWRAEASELRAIGLDGKTVNNLVKTRQQFDVDRELELINKLGVSVVTWDCPGYPNALKTISDPPFVLYVRGELIADDEWAVALVGTRKATTYGKECVRSLAHGLVKSGSTVVSGLAYGIDTEAHKAALKANGRTIAVLGCGVDINYPAANRNLAQAISESGAIISEYPLGTRPEPKNFPRRNRIISGLSLGIVVVEGPIKSGANITARYALEQGREVFAVPGSILHHNSSGPHHLIQNGAKLVMEVNDILEELNLTQLSQHVEARTLIPDNDTEAILLKNLSPEPTHIDDLGQLTGLQASELASALTMMELKGMVRQVGSMNYVLAR
ncbi:DNA-processing protein DprA [Anaerolineales bacterium HSG6]|nr:DNA-processing protein DprA [Anaerolineales bacterium HSG6]